MPSPEQRAKVAAHLKLADGFKETAWVGALSSEYDIRNSISRLCYAFLHASLALLHTDQSNVGHVPTKHGKVRKGVQRKMGKSMGERLLELYEFRIKCDYEADLMQTKYGGNIVKAREEAMSLLNNAEKDFYRIRQEAGKPLKDQ